MIGLWNQSIPTEIPRMSACNCINKLFIVIPPSTWRDVNGIPQSMFIASKSYKVTSRQLTCIFKPLRKYESGVKQFKTMLYSILYTLFNSSTTHEHRYVTSCLCTLSYPIEGYVHLQLFNQRPQGVLFVQPKLLSSKILTSIQVSCDITRGCDQCYYEQCWQQ